MKKYLFCLLLLPLLLSGCLSAGEEPEATPELAAVINGEAVPQYLFDYYFNDYYRSYYNDYYDYFQQYLAVDLLDAESAREELARIEAYAWRTTVQAVLIRQLAQQEYFIALEPTTVSDALEPGLAAYIEANRYYSELYPLMQQEAQNAYQVSDAEAQARYEADPAAWDCRKINHIFVPLSDEAGREEALAEAEALLQQLTEGADFQQLAAAYQAQSTLMTNAAQDFYFNQAGKAVIGEGEIYAEVAEAAFALEEPGAYVEEPVVSPYGYHIIQLLDAKEGFAAVQEEVRVSLQTVSADDVAAYFQQKIDALEAVAEIERKMEFRYYRPEGEADSGAE